MEKIEEKSPEMPLVLEIIFTHCHLRIGEISGITLCK